MRAPWLLTLLVLLAAIVPVAGFSDYHLFQMTMVVVYAHRHPGSGAADRLQRADLAGPWGVLCHRRLYLGDSDDVLECALLADAAGLGRRVRHCWLSGRPAGAAAGRAVPGADHVRAGGRGAAIAEIQAGRGLDRRCAGSGDRQAGRAVRIER